MLSIKRLFVVLIIAAVGCSGPTANEQKAASSKPLVSAVHPTVRDVNTYREFPGKVVYLSKSQILAPFAGYLTSVKVLPGQEVNKGQVLATLESKEHRALKGDTAFAKSSLTKYGLTSLRAEKSGFIAAVKQLAGDYVPEGTSLFTLTAFDQIFVKTMVPLDFQSKIRMGESCRIQLADTVINGKVARILNQLDTASQALQVMVQARSPMRLSEGQFANVEFVDQHLQKAVLLPAGAILSNERLTQFWVMTLENDTTAIHQDVKIGPRLNDSIVILHPEFSTSQRVLSEGNYGLPDTAYIQLKAKP